MNNNEYVKLSLELHLFFDRIMKEHSLFLEMAFTEKNKKLKEIARKFQNSFEELLKETIYMADGNLSSKFLNSNEIVTKNTLDAELKTSNLSGSYIDSDITRKELSLRIGDNNINNELVNRVSLLNKKTLPKVENLIRFKKDILEEVLSCKMYTTNYPLLITHIMNEAKMYYMLLNKVENRTIFTKEEIYEQELFWNNIMMEHATFIRGLLDPSEEELILKADKFSKEYKMIIKNYNNTLNDLTKISLNETINFRNFKVAGEEGILNCKIKSIIIPLLADHVVREANHFIRILDTQKI